MSSTYTCRLCILDLLAASGPQELWEFRHECQTQVPGCQPGDHLTALDAAITAGEIVYDTEYGAYELADTMYDARGMLKPFKEAP